MLEGSCVPLGGARRGRDMIIMLLMREISHQDGVHFVISSEVSSIT